MAIFESIIGGLGSIASGLLGKSSADKNNEAIMRNAAEDRAFQREAANNGISWRVEDAKRAGIAPLAALGAQTFNPSPISIGSLSSDNSFGTGLAAAGQNLGRAMDATRSSRDKVDAFTKSTQDLTLQRMGLENELLASQLRTTMPTGRMPPMPNGRTPQLVDGQTGTNTVTVSGVPVTDDPPKQSRDSIPALRIIRPAGIPVRTNPYTTDAQDIEDRYGDIVEEVGGVANLAADGLYTLWQAGKGFNARNHLFRDRRRDWAVRGPR